MVHSKSREGKIVIFGEPGVGKTCFNDMFVGGQHFIFHNPLTESFRKKLTFDGVNWTLALIDISSALIREQSETLDRFTFNMWVREAHGVVLLYDITSMSSFDRITNDGYVHVILRRCEDSLRPDGLIYPAGGPRFGCVLVGNKADLAAERRQVPKELAQDWADSQGMQFFELNSSDEAAIEEVMKALMKSIARAERRDAEDIEREKKKAEKQKGENKKGISSWMQKGRSSDDEGESMLSKISFGSSVRNAFKKSSS